MRYVFSNRNRNERLYPQRHAHLLAARVVLEEAARQDESHLLADRKRAPLPLRVVLEIKPSRTVLHAASVKLYGPRVVAAGQGHRAPLAPRVCIFEHRIAYKARRFPAEGCLAFGQGEVGALSFRILCSYIGARRRRVSIVGGFTLG